ncbi:MAG: TonB-dependent receptor [Pseudomonadota bacterium]
MICSAALAAFAAATPAFAQDDTEVEAVVITGSRIATRDLVTDSVIQTVSDQDIKDVAAITVESLLNQLPGVVPSFGSANNNPGNGQALIDLRGLGSNRNVVLLDGRRMVPNTSTLVTDANTIPVALIERVEVVTGGASAVYGADAVAGVVNFITKTNFEGVEADAQYGISEMGDAGEYAASLTIGGNFADDRGNAVLSIGWAQREEVGKGDRDFTAQATSTTSYFPSGTYRTAGNLPTQAAVNAVFAGYGVAANSVCYTGGGAGFGFNGDGTLYATGSSGQCAVNAGAGVATPFDIDIENFRRDPSEIATAFAPDFFSFNFEPFNKLILPLDRKNFYTAVNYDISDSINVYARANLVTYSSSTALAPSPAPTSGNPLYPGQNLFEFTIPVTNPFIPADLAALLASRTGDNPVLAGTGADEEFAYRFRTNALGPRVEQNDRTSMQFTTGLKWDLGSEWTADAFYSWGKYEETTTQTGNLAVRKFEELLDAADGGASLCGDGFNPFGVGFLGNGCRAYASVVAKNRTTIESNFAQVVLTGPAFELPAGEVGVAAGAEYRSYDYKFLPDSALQPGEVAGFNGSPPLNGYLDFYDLFGEVAIPLLKDLPYVQALDLTLGARFSDNNLTGADTSWKAELSWQPIESLRFRGSVQKAVRSPNVAELFSAAGEDNPEVFDPCNANLESGAANPDRSPAILALCNAQAAALGLGSQAGYNQSAAQISAVTGGNPDLQPETADTYTFGAVWRPGFESSLFSNFSISLDYYSIEIEDVVASSDPSVIVNRCYNLQDSANPTLDANNPWCQLFSRSPGSFEIVDLQEISLNQAVLSTSGWDLSINWQTDLEAMGLWGRLGVNVQANLVDKYESQTSNADPVLDYAGTIGTLPGEYLPEFRANVNLSYDIGDFGADLRIRYLDNAKHENDVPVDSPTATGVPATYYLDLATRYAINDNVEVRFNVLNLLDQQIREYDPFVDAQTNPSVYDVIGRRYSVGVNLRF